MPGAQDAVPLRNYTRGIGHSLADISRLIRIQIPGKDLWQINSTNIYISLFFLEPIDFIDVTGI